MSTQIPGMQTPTTNTESPRVAVEEPKHAAEGLTLAPDRPPTPSADASSSSSEEEPKSHRPRGFAAMDRKLVSEIARKGGKAAHSAGTAHEFTSEEAREAGRKGGRATHAKRRRAADEATTSPPAEPTKGG
jgi:general stress protein YciG